MSQWHRSILAIRLVHAIVPTRKGVFDSVYFPRDISCHQLPYDEFGDGRHNFESVGIVGGICKQFLQEL